MDALKKLNQAQTLVEEATAIITDTVEKKTEELQSLNESIESAKETLGHVTKDLKGKKADFDGQSKAFDTELKELTDKIEFKKKELALATTDVAKARMNHNQFVQYEITHRKALEAREQSIAEREDAVASVIGQMKRRKQIVSEIV